MKDISRVLKIRGWTHIRDVLKQGWRDPYWWKRQLISRLLGPLLFRKNNGTYLLEKEFDNLIILDACRYDFLESEITKSGFNECKLESIISRATHTQNFLIENFGNKKFDSLCREIVYITANPFVSRELKDVFHKIIPVWMFGWNKEFLTVRPEAVYKAALQASNEFSEKKLIIHFIQPHHPFIKLGSVGSDLANLRNTALFDRLNKTDESIWSLLEKGKIDNDIVIWGYRQNLRIVLPYVQKLCKILPGRTIITADHGEAMGEKIHPLIPIKIYGHPPKVRIDCLIKVPWLICEKGV